MIGNIKLRAKLLLLCSAFLLPIAYLSYAFVALVQKDIEVIVREKGGVHYFERAHHVAISLANIAIDADKIAELKQDQKRLFSLSSPYNKIETAQALSAAINALAQKPIDMEAKLEQAFSAYTTHISNVDDISGVTHDPLREISDIGAVALFKLPALVVAANDTYQKVRPLMEGQSTPDVIVPFLRSRSEVERLLKDLDKEMSFSLMDDGAKVEVLEASYRELQAAAGSYMGQLDVLERMIGDKPSATDLLKSYSTVQRALESMLAASTKELDRLLEQRIDNLRLQLEIKLWSAFGIFMCAMCAAWFIGRSITSPAADINRAMELLADGDTSVDVPHLYRGDEFGVMANAVDILKTNAIKMHELHMQRVIIDKITTDFEHELSDDKCEEIETSKKLRLMA